MIKREFKKFDRPVPLAIPTMHGEELVYMTEAHETNWMSTVGANIDEVERLVAQKIGCGYAVALSCGTAALHMAVRLAASKVAEKYTVNAQKEEKNNNAYINKNLPADDILGYTGRLAGQHVLCSDMTFSATVNPIVYEGGIPVFVDTEYDTWNMDPQALEKAFESYPDARIVCLAHLYGTPAKMDEIRAVCDRHGAIIIEDAAESFGATYKGRQTGAFGDFSAVSFNGNKIITGSAGGMFLTDSKEDADKIRKWSTQARDTAPWYQHTELGYNYRMSNVVAGVVRGQLPYLEDHIEKKREIYNRYKKGLEGLPVSMNPYDIEHSVPNHWLSCMIIDRDAMCVQTRTDSEATYEAESGKSCPTEILEALARHGAEGRPIWKPMHAQPIFASVGFVTRNGVQKVSHVGDGAGKHSSDCDNNKNGISDVLIMKNSDANCTGCSDDVGMDIFERGLCLPSHIGMTKEEQDRVIDIIRACFE